MKKQKPNFEQAINAAILWCNSWEDGNISDEVLADRVAELIETIEGARGFFVVSLSTDCPLMDRLPDPLVLQLRKGGELIVALTTKNLVMSSAMAANHQMNQNLEQQSESERITSRCIELLRLLDPNTVKKHLENMLTAIKGEGKEVNFIDRWKYNRKQKLAIVQSINSVAQA
tara:strand:- start:2001 stop:2519 length:519 start_codon:yes stop_codon:yes gene_type:complete